MMTLDELRKLGAPLLTRAIADVVCGWTQDETGELWEGVHPTGLTLRGSFRVGHYVATVFNPLTSIDDAVMCVSKLDNRQLETWEYKLQDLVVSDKAVWIFPRVYANASAELRILALVNTVPEIMVRYNELMGEK